MDLTEAIENIRHSIVQISVFAAGFSPELRQRLGRPSLGNPLGTGFLVNQDGYVVTANHVIESGNQFLGQMEAAEKKGMQVGFAYPNSEYMRGNFNTVDFEVAGRDSRHDLALLKLRRNPFKGELHSGIIIAGQEIPIVFRAARLEPRRPKDGARVGISGYPLLETVLVTNSGHMASVWSFNIQESPIPGAPEGFRMPNLADSYLADAQANPGNSGGPVYLVDTAEVIGVCVGAKSVPILDQNGSPATVGEARLFYDSGLTLVVPSQYVLELIERQTAGDVFDSVQA